MRKTPLFILCFFLGCLSIPEAHAETAYERVIRTGVLRCGYLVWAPYVTKNLKTGKLGGVFVDLAEALGKVLNLKIEWAQEYALGTQIESLKSNKIDALCLDGPWTRSAMPFIAYSHPMLFPSVYTYVRKNGPYANTTSLDALDTPRFKLSEMDGDISQDVAAVYFPKAQPFSLPGSADPILLMENVATGKADGLVEDALTVADYNKNNKNTLVAIGSKKPMAAYPGIISALPQETQLIDMLNRGIDFMNDTGSTVRILKKYDPTLKDLMPPRERYSQGMYP